MPQWESFFWPNTQVLKNKLGLKDEATLTAMERLHTTLQAERIASGLIQIDRTFDAAHIKATHAALFSRIYTWAGEFRTVNMRRSRAHQALGQRPSRCWSRGNPSCGRSPWWTEPTRKAHPTDNLTAAMRGASVSTLLRSGRLLRQVGAHRPQDAERARDQSCGGDSATCDP